MKQPSFLTCSFRHAKYSTNVINGCSRKLNLAMPNQIEMLLFATIRKGNIL